MAFVGLRRRLLGRQLGAENLSGVLCIQREFADPVLSPR